MTTACILWKGALNSGGYPVTWENGKTVYKHRLIVGAILEEVVMHSCDTPSCVNPEHLKIGSHKQNSEDMVLKSRQAFGESCGNSKFKQKDILEVRKYKGVLSSREVGKLFNMSKTNVLDIWNNKIWKINE